MIGGMFAQWLRLVLVVASCLSLLSSTQPPRLPDFLALTDKTLANSKPNTRLHTSTVCFLQSSVSAVTWFSLAWKITWWMHFIIGSWLWWQVYLLTKRQRHLWRTSHLSFHMSTDTCLHVTDKLHVGGSVFTGGGSLASKYYKGIPRSQSCK